MNQQPSRSKEKETYFPLEIGQFASGEKVYELVVVVSRKRRGSSIGRIIQKLEEDGYEIIKIFGGSIDSSHPKATYEIFVESSGARGHASRLGGEISSLDSGLRAYIWGPERFLVDTHSTPLLQMGIPTVLAGSGVVGEVEKAIENVGPRGTSALRWGGVHTALDQLNRVDKNLPKETQFSRIIDIAQSSGWGIFELFPTKKNAPPPKVLVRNSFEALSHREKTETPVCHILEGFLSGLASAIYHDGIFAYERACIAQKSKSRVCKFVFEKNNR